MTDPNITVALISAISTVVVGILTLIGVLFANKKSSAKIQKNNDELSVDLKQKQLDFMTNVQLAQSNLISDIQKENIKLAGDIRREIEVYKAATDTKIDELTREVREHNNFARRMPVLEEKLINSNFNLERLNDRLDKIEDKINDN